MFTGIIKHFGEIERVTAAADGVRLTVAAAPQLLREAAIGDSIAVNGCCLTLAAKPSAATGEFALSPQTLARIVPFVAGEQVHLETALRAGDPLGGHLVTGHIDGAAQLRAWQPQGDCALATFAMPAGVDPRLAAAQGSVALAGVSLTVASVAGSLFCVQFVKHTLAATLLHPDKALAGGAKCNFEADCLARYALRAAAPVLES